MAGFFRGIKAVSEICIYMILSVLSVSCAQVKADIDNNRVVLARQQMNKIGAALDMYKEDKGEYPPEEKGLDALRNYLSPPEVTADPWGVKYRYRREMTGIREYELYSCGPDKIEGTEDDIIIWKLR